MSKKDSPERKAQRKKTRQEGAKKTEGKSKNRKGMWEAQEKGPHHDHSTRNPASRRGWKKGYRRDNYY